MSSRWDDDQFLDGLRAQADPLADATVGALIAEHGVATANQIFATLGTDRCPLAADTPGPLRDFLDQTSHLPAGVDRQRLERGPAAFMERAASGAIILLASSLPQGYGAPALCEILTISDNLATRPYKRLMGVVQLLVNLAAPGAFGEDGEAILTAQKLRLLHAGVRTIVPRYHPDYVARFGAPSNHEDMLATIMAFSYLVVDGYRTLGLQFDEAEDFYYSWRTFARMMGIHPAGCPDDDAYVPEDLAAARTFYESYGHRNYRDPEDNPHGPVLAARNLEMMENMLPHTLRRLGFDRAPRVLMTELLSDQDLARVAIEPAVTEGLSEKLLKVGLTLAQDFTRHEPHLVDVLARHVFQEMIDRARGGEVNFIIPDSLSALRSQGLV